MKPRLSVATPPGGPSLRPALVSEMLANVTAAEKRVCKCACVSVCGGWGGPAQGPAGLRDPWSEINRQRIFTPVSSTEGQLSKLRGEARLQACDETFNTS